MNHESKSPISFLQLIRRSEHGKLKVYLGHAPGVGKTYQMLQEGHRLKAEGIDVVVGLVETHSRRDIENLLDGLEIVPRERITYRGITLEEMNLDALLARKPQVALVDELAHTNPPDHGNSKRYMDVQDLLAAGIHVITTMNVQHLESLYNTVESLIHVKVMERLPDAILKEADEIVNVDLSPEDLQKRLKAGKIYPADRVPTALENYFQPQNLEQLRELALRETASQIDFHRREHPSEHDENVPDQIMVCLTSSGANNAHLLRYASRLAGQLNRKWYAVYVQTPAAIDAAIQRSLSDVLTLANQLGAMVFTFRGQDVVDTILRFAHEYRVGRIVVGKSRPLPRWKRLLGHQTLVEHLLEKAAGLSVTVVGSGVGIGALSLTEVAEENEIAGSRIEPGEKKIQLSKILKPSDIIIWNELISREDILRDLAKIASQSHPDLDFEDTLRALQKRESEISTFLNEGVAVPHAVMESLKEIIIAFGVTRQGVENAPAGRPIEAVFMALYPSILSADYLRLMSTSLTALRDRQLLRGLAAAHDAREIWALLRTWERARK